MKLKQVARHDQGKIKGESLLTPEGYIKTDAIVTRCGVFTYKNADGSIRKELRHPDDVLKTESLETIKMIPITNGHPQNRLVTAENAKELTVGYTGENISTQDEYILSNLLVTDQNSVNDILNNGRKQLSLGYIVNLVEEEGEYQGENYDYRQTDIFYNHLSLVDNARAGQEAQIKLDCNDAIEISKEEINMAKHKIKIDEEEVMVTEKTSEYYENLLNDMRNLTDEKERIERELSNVREQIDKVSAERDQMKAELDETGNPDVDNNPDNKAGTAEEEMMKMDSQEFRDLVKERVELEKMAESLVSKEIKIDSLNNMELKREIVRNNSKVSLDGKSAVYVDAAFDIIKNKLSEKVKATPKGKISCDAGEDNAQNARQRMINKMKGAK